MILRKVISSILIFVCLILSNLTYTQEVYYPGKWGDWEKKTPAEVGISDSAIDDAVQYAMDNESENPRNLERMHIIWVLEKNPLAMQ